MSRRNPNLIEALIAASSKFPWWLGGMLAIVAYAGLHSLAAFGMARWLPGGMDDLVSQNLFRIFTGVGQYLLPSVFLIGAALSVYGRYRRSASHPQGTGSLGSGALNSMSWKAFESVVCEGFRRKGYSVTEKGGNGTDGGIDLALKKNGKAYLVQCKQWRAIQVGVTSVRELHGAMATRGASGGFVVTSGVFTDEAQAYARGKNIELMDGKSLHALIRGVSVPVKFFRDPLSVMTTGAPFCPECQSRMVKKKVRSGPHAGHEFWRCSRHPDCKGVRQI